MTEPNRPVSAWDLLGIDPERERREVFPDLSGAAQPAVYTCPECPATFTDGVALYRHTGEHIEADWQAIRNAPGYRFTIPDEDPNEASTHPH